MLEHLSISNHRSTCLTIKAVGRSEKQEGAGSSNMLAIICPMGETGLTNLPKFGGGHGPPTPTALGLLSIAFFCGAIIS